MDLGIKGSTALVLGAGGGLGGAIARALAREGATLAIADVDGAALEATAAAIAAAGGSAQGFVWDIAHTSGPQSRLEDILAATGGIDILVNNTGGPPPSPVSGVAVADWRKQFEAMVLSVIAITDAVLPGMRERRFGRIITSASSGVIAPIPNLGLSNALRSTLVGWSKTLAREVARDNVTSNIIVPGRIATARIKALDAAKAKRENRAVEDVQAESLAAIPMGRYGDPEEYADAVAFLASRRASYITGSIVRVDGGYIANV